jgi:hypothetical protein
MTTDAPAAARRTTRLGGFLAGLGALVSIWPDVTVPPRESGRSDGEALRADWQRIGNDMRRVIAREHALLETAAE